MSEVTTLPIWKKGATAYERLSELALLAKECPEKFKMFVIVYQETLPNGNWKFKYMDFGATDIFQTIGLLEAGKMKCYESSAL